MRHGHPGCLAAWLLMGDVVTEAGEGAPPSPRMILSRAAAGLRERDLFSESVVCVIKKDHSGKQVVSTEVADLSHGRFCRELTAGGTQLTKEAHDDLLPRAKLGTRE